MRRKNDEEGKEEIDRRGTRAVIKPVGRVTMDCEFEVWTASRLERRRVFRYSISLCLNGRCSYAETICDERRILGMFSSTVTSFSIDDSSDRTPQNGQYYQSPCKHTEPHCPPMSATVLAPPPSYPYCRDAVSYNKCIELLRTRDRP